MNAASKAMLKTGRRDCYCSGFWFALICGLISIQALAGGRPTYRADPTYLIDTWETEDGLPENSATAMVQTPDGYLWFGTFSGLVRFDGVKFTVLNPSNTPGLPNAGIVNLHLDKAGRLWVSTYGGLVVLEKGEWRTLGKDQGWVGDFARTFTERASGDLLITAFNGAVFEYVGGRITQLPAPPGAPGKGYTGAVDGAGHWWVAQSRFIGWWDGQRWTSALATLADAKEDVGCAASHDGGIWVCRGTELMKMRDGTEISRRTLPINPGGHWGMSEDNSGNVWICSFNGGVSRVAPDGEMRRWNITNGLVHNGVRFVFEDREKNVWVGTSGGGLNRFKPRRFRSYGAESGLSERVVRSTSPAPGGGEWIATYGRGLFRLQGSNLTPVQIAAAPGIPGYIQSVLTDRAGRTWVGSGDQGLWQIDSGGARKIADQSVGGTNVISQFGDSKGRIWMGNGHGVTMVDGERFSIYATAQGLPDASVHCFAEDSEGVLWLTNLDAVFRWEKGEFVEIRDEQDRPLKNVSCLKGDADGGMWMGLSEGGLLRWRSKRIDRIDETAGFPSVNVLGILDDGNGCFWMASNRGVIRIPRNDLNAVADGKAMRVNAILLGTEDGLPGVECAGGNQPVCAKDERGKVWFATMKGLAVINPAEFKLNASPPPIQIEDLVYYRPSANSGSVPNTSPPITPGGVLGKWHPVLPPGSRRIEVHYTALSFVAPDKVRFQIKLEGQDLDWQDMDNRRTAYFQDLEPRDYVFRVRASNNDGVWNDEAASLAFTVQPFYWQTWWFRAGVALLLVMIGAGIYWRISRWRNRLSREAQQRLRQVFEASPNALITLDEHGKIILVNEETKTVFGYTQEELIGASIEMLIPESARPTHPDNRQEFLAELQAGSVGDAREAAGRCKDGSTVPLEVRLSAVRATKGMLVLASITDTTARKQAERDAAQQRNELAHLSRVTMMGELSGSMAHELNQPLTAILSNAQAALRYLAHDSADLDEVRGILKDIVNEDKRAGEVIRRLRLLFKKGEVLFQPLDLNEAIEDVLKLLHSDLVNHNVVVDGKLADGLPDVYGDRVQLQQVLINLIINGCDAMTETPSSERRLSVRTEPANGDGVSVLVGDHGCGIAPDRLESVFEPFVTTKSKGMGLGLAVCRTIITAHGGRLWAENNPDAGACFIFTLPTPKKETE